MPRSREYDRQVVIDNAMWCFWRNGYYATSVSDLVAATKVNRHGLYSEFDGKRGLFLAAAQNYTMTVVNPAFEIVEREGAGLPEIRQYFETQIALAERSGLPGPGCLIANTMTESGPHDRKFTNLVRRHLDRLTIGFQKAIDGHLSDASTASSQFALRDAGWFLTVSAQGLWSVSRTVSDAGPLHAYVEHLLQPLESSQDA